MADSCEFCTHYIMDDELGNYCDVDLDEDEMEKFLNESVTQCHYFRADDEYSVVRKQN